MLQVAAARAPQLLDAALQGAGVIGSLARVIENTSAVTPNSFVEESVSHKVSLVCTDDRRGYRYIDKNFPHGMVHHGEGEYIHGNVHSNTIEGFWSLVKLGIIGTFHKVSRKYLLLCVNEFAFRYNDRNNADIFGTAIKVC